MQHRQDLIRSLAFRIVQRHLKAQHFPIIDLTIMRAEAVGPRTNPSAAATDGKLFRHASRGIGSAVYRGVCALGFGRGFDAVCVLPAGEGLYPFYEAGGGARIVSSVRETEYSAQELRGAGRLPCARIPVEEYAGIRESLLQGEAHGAMPESFYRWQDSLCGRYGGGLFVLDGGVAAAEMDGGVCCIRELLVPGGDEKAAAAALASFCRAERYVVRAPAFGDGPGTVRRHMLARLREEPAFYLPDDLWWGFAFD